MRLKEFDKKLKQQSDIIRHRQAFDKMEKAMYGLLGRYITPVDNSIAVKESTDLHVS